MQGQIQVLWSSKKLNWGEGGLKRKSYKNTSRKLSIRGDIYLEQKKMSQKVTENLEIPVLLRSLGNLSEMHSNVFKHNLPSLPH